MTAKIRAITALVVITAAIMFTSAAAVATDDPCDYSVPEVPGECLSSAAYSYIYNLQATVNVAQEGAAYYHQKSDALWVDKLALQQQVADVTAQRDAAAKLANARYLRIVTLRAKVMELRHILRDIIG